MRKQSKYEDFSIKTHLLEILIDYYCSGQLLNVLSDWQFLDKLYCLFKYYLEKNLLTNET